MSSLWFDQEHLEGLVSPANPAIAPSSFPRVPGPSLIDDYFELSQVTSDMPRVPEFLPLRPEFSLMSSQCFDDQERLEFLVSPAYPVIAPSSFPCHPERSIPIDCHSSFENPLTEKQAYLWNGNGSTKGGRPRVTVDMLPDVALLEIFDFYVDKEWIGMWVTLVHVCRQWRNVVFGSLRRLNLLLHCTDSTPVRETMDTWPLLPILISGYGREKWGADNIIAALEYDDRIRRIDLFDFPSLQMEKVLAEMHRPFPALKHLILQSGGEIVPVVPTSLLGGSAPRLQTLLLESIPFPGLPKLLLSATHLVELTLRKIPHSGYISPEAMVTCLSVLTRLEKLVIDFESPRCCPDRKSRHLPPRTRTLLPVLTKLSFRGVGEYLDDLVARIDAPLLGELDVTFFCQLIFDTPHLAHFISRTPKFKEHNKAYASVEFSDWAVWVKTFDRALTLAILCRQSDWQLSSLAQLCSLSFHQVLIPTVAHLYILEGGQFPPCWQDDIETSQWLELLHPFTAVKDLYISREFTPRIAPTLKELVGERVTEVLPALQTLFLEEKLPSGPVQEIIEQFVASRQLAGHPITVSHWE